jgi:capsular polysaccharide biosynthesis protein
MLLPPEGQFDHTDIMQALGYGDIQVIRSSSPYVSCESVMHVEYGEIEHFPARYLRSLQARIASKFHGLSRNNRILVMRKELRSISNISAFVEMLTPLGFRPYFLEDMQFEEQVEIFARAEFIVAPHGAGLSNLIFSPPECRVIELSPDCEMRPFFWEISCKLGHIYGMLPCATHDGGFNGRLMVDLEKFRVLYTLVEKQW